MADEIDAAIGRRLMRRRQILGMTQQKVGEAIGVRFQQVQKYECGANRISAARLWALAQALDVDVSYFFDGVSGARYTSSPKESYANQKETADLVYAFISMDARPRKKLLMLAKELSDGRNASTAAGKRPAMARLDVH